MKDIFQNIKDNVIVFVDEFDGVFSWYSQFD